VSRFGLALFVEPPVNVAHRETDASAHEDAAGIHTVGAPVSDGRDRHVEVLGGSSIVISGSSPVIALETGEILSTHDIDPNRTYWRNTQRTPGRWPGVL